MVFHNRSVPHGDCPVSGCACQLEIMRDHDDRQIVLVQFREEGGDLPGILKVEISRRLIGEEHLRPFHDCASNGNALLLSTRKIGWAMIQAISEAELLEGLSGETRAFSSCRFIEVERRFDILQRRVVRYKIKRLKHHSHFVCTIRRQLPTREAREGNCSELHGSGRWRVQSCKKIEESSLAGSRRADDRKERSALDIDRYLIESTDDVSASLVVATKIFAIEMRFHDRH